MADAPPDRRPSADPNWVGENDGAPDDGRYDPSSVEATRERQQGLGVGALDLQRQRDPSRPAADEADGDADPDAGDVDNAA